MGDKQVTVKTTTCPFCLNGCTSGVDFDGYQYRMSYVTDGEVNKGKLCPRGNSTSIVIDHPKRLGYPLLDGHVTTWQKAGALVKEWAAAVRPEEMAIVYSRGRAADEVRMIHGLAQALGTPNLVCGHIEPENSFNSRLEGVKDATLKQVESAQSVLLVGDVFNTSPVATGRILEARYADRKNRLVVIDSVKTRQSGFAHLFLQVKPGTEPFALLALAALLDGKALAKVDIDKLSATAGLERPQLESAAKLLEGPGFVGSAMHTGRVYHPELHSLAAQLVALKSKKSFVGFRETALPTGTMSFTRFREAVDGGRIRMVFWTGGLFPYSYAEVFPEMSKVEFRVATSIFVPDPPVPGLVLPMTAELERDSTGSSYWSEIERSALAPAYSGTKQFADALGLLGDAKEAAEGAPTTVKVDAVLKMAEKALGAPRGADGFLLVGEKRAIGLRGFFDGERSVQVNPADASSLGVTDENCLLVKTPSASLEFGVHVTDSVPAGVLLVGSNVHRNRTLFPLAVDPSTGETTVPPVPVEVEKAMTLATPASETRAV